MRFDGSSGAEGKKATRTGFPVVADRVNSGPVDGPRLLIEPEGDFRGLITLRLTFDHGPREAGIPHRVVGCPSP